MASYSTYSLESQKPSSGLIVGDLAYVIESNRLYEATNSTTWGTPTVMPGGLILPADPITTFTGDGVWRAISSKLKTADQSISNSTTLTDDTDLQFTMTASVSYRFDILIFVTSASATPDFKFQITSAITPADIRYQVEVWQAGVGLTLDGHTIETAYNSVISANWGAPPNTYCRLQGTVTNGATIGTFKVQWAQRVSNATATTVKRGSSLNIFQLIT